MQAYVLLVVENCAAELLRCNQCLFYLNLHNLCQPNGLLTRVKLSRLY